MKNNLSLSPTITGKRFLVFFRRFHLLLFFLVVSICLFTAIFILLPITNISSSNNTAPSGTPVDSTFDEATVEKLRNASQSPSEPKSTQRMSPFFE